MRSLLPALLLVALTGCASARKGSRCAPVTEDLIEIVGDMVYSECTVEQRARMTMQARIDYPYQIPRNIACLYADLRGVVDPTGKLVDQTVDVTAANDARFVEMIVASLDQVRFSAAKVQGKAVHQVVRMHARIPVPYGVATSGVTSSRPFSESGSC